MTFSQATTSMKERIQGFEALEDTKVSLTQDKEDEVRESRTDDTHQEEVEKVTASLMQPESKSTNPASPALLPQVNGLIC